MRILRQYATICALATITLANAGELTLDREPNLSDVLSYSYAIRGGVDSLTNNIVELTDAKLKKGGIKVESVSPSEVDNLIDIVATVVDSNNIAIGGDTIAYKSQKDASKKLSKYLTNYFFGGDEPECSVVFESGKDGYVSYRIPSVITLPSGRIIAFIEARAFHKDTAENDMIAKYSDDGGETWSDPILVRGDGKSSLNNPCVTYIEEENKILLIYQLYPPKTSEADSLGGTKGDNIQKVFSVVSMDEGESWSTPVDITEQIKHPKSSSVCSGPGVGIRVALGENRGRIIIPFNALNAGVWFNYLAYSDDLGKSWGILPGESSYGTNESQVIEIGDSEFVIFARSHRNSNCESVETPEGWSPWNFAKITRNKAKIGVTINGDSATWHNTVIDSTIIDPLCQGSVIRISGLDDDCCSRVVVSNPASNYTINPEKRGYSGTPPMRINGTVRLSYDNGDTWCYSKRIYGDRLTEFGYSVLTNLGGGNIGCLFETSGVIKFTKFNLDWLTNGKDKGKGL